MGNRNRSWNRPGSRARVRRDPGSNLFEQALLGSDDESRKIFDPRTDRKTRQLCRQVERAIMQALAGECGDDLLRDLCVESVDPAGGAGHLVCRVILPRNASVDAVMQRLSDRSARLRSIVAGAICRKRVPTLSFIAIPGGEGGRHVGDE